jgi:hypothetical protein
MRLLLNGHSLSVAQMGPDFIFLTDPIDYPPTTARFVLQIDDNERSWEIRLPDGLSASARRVSIAPPD